MKTEIRWHTCKFEQLYGTCGNDLSHRVKPQQLLCSQWLLLLSFFLISFIYLFIYYYLQEPEDE